MHLRGNGILCNRGGSLIPIVFWPSQSSCCKQERTLGGTVAELGSYGVLVHTCILEYLPHTAPDEEGTLVIFF